MDDIRVRAIGHTVVAEADSTADQAAAAKRAAAKSASAAAAQATNAPTKCRVYFEGGWREDTQVSRVLDNSFRLRGTFEN